MQSLLIFIIICLAAWLFWRYWGRQLFLRHLQRKMEDNLRQAFGMPPRPKKGNASRGSRQQSDSSTDSDRYSSRARGYAGSEPIIPPEYAEDVEYVEIKEFTQTEIGEKRADGSYVHEQQVSDAEWEEIKIKK